MFLSILESFKQIYGYYPRPGVCELLKLINKKLKAEDPKFLVFFSAPTGYGKSSCTVVIANRLVEKPNRLGERLIHVLPMRSIVEDLYTKVKSKKEEGKLTKLTLGAQAMHLLDVEKSPYMLPGIVYTTIDSFIHNLFKRPVAEFYRDHSHFDIPRYAIYSSLVTFDEAHLFSSEVEVEEEKVREKHNRMLTSFYASIKALTEASVPVIIMTATMPDKYVQNIIEHTPNNTDKYLIEVGPSRDIFKKRALSSSTSYIKKIIVDDHKFYEDSYKNNPKIQGIINEKDVEKIILELKSFGNPKILVVKNTVSKALETYQRLTKNVRGLIRILHGRMNVEDRQNVLQLIKRIEEKEKEIILVATQVIEAGVDIDFDILISDATTFSSLVQRVGRIGRKIDRKRMTQLSIYIIDGDGDKVYSKRLVETTMNWLKDLFFQKKVDVGWRVAIKDETYGELVSYKWLLEKIYNKVEYLEDRSLLKALTDIDHYFVALKSKELQRKLCSFVREEGLMAISSWMNDDKKFKDGHEALENAYKTMLPLNVSFIISKWRDLLDVNEEAVKVLVCEGKWLRIEKSKELYKMLDRLNKPCIFLDAFDGVLNKFRKRNLIPLAAILKSGSYEREVGLKIEQ
ncbi:TPA: CRISPR-associated helicase Cas3' [Candidatus Bathyarchaeota archaeon]|nr:CRISPR-associated helicase Cas3' [Candidatus Bathyarchaeota archaeon]